MAKTQFLDYTIYLTDAAQVAELQGATHAGGAVGRTIIPPTEAAVTYSAPIQEESTAMTAPCIRSEWFTTGNNFPRNERTFERCTGGWFGICFLFGSRTKFYWRGQFKFVPTVTAEAPVGSVKRAMAKRRWVDGAEMPVLGEGGSGNAGAHVSRAASRHLQGFGYTFDQSTNERTHTPIESGGAASNQQWERFYPRFRVFPPAESLLWRIRGSVQNASGIKISILPTGQITIRNVDSVGTETLLGTLPPVTTHTRYKWDILVAYATGVGGVGATVQFYQNGVLLASLTGLWTTIGGLGVIQNIASSTIGNPAGNTCVWEVDDWIGAELPTGTAGVPAFVGTFPGLDWNNGSRVAFVSADAFGTDNAASWAATGTFRLVRQRLTLTGVAPPNLSSSTGNAKLSVRTDAIREIDNSLGQLGLAAMTISIFSFDSNGVSGQLGYRLHDIDADVLAVVTQDNANYQWRQVFYQPSMIDPISPCNELTLLFVRGAGADTTHVQCLAASAEIIGVFGPEDIVPGAVNQVGTQTAAPSINLATQTSGYVTDIKAKNTAALISMVGNCGAFEITKRVAWGLRHEGAGLQFKSTGANCGSRAVGIIMFPTGRAVDILGDAGGANTPQWTAIPDLDPTLYRAPEDPGDAGTLTAGPPEHIGIHNAPYPHTQWSRRGTPPFSPVVVHAGTYIGTDTFIDLPFRAPVHFLAIRALSGFSGGHFWWSSQTSGHFAGQRGQRSSVPVDVLINPAFPVAPPAEDAQEQQTIVRIVGNGADSNALGTVYQYTAFSDPAHRFALAGATVEHSGAAFIFSNLDDEAYTPLAVFAQQELNGLSATVGLHFKGPGHGSLKISPAGGAEIDGLTLSRGQLASGGTLNDAALDHVAFIAFRENDNSGDAGIGNVVKVTSYLGDGNASRSIGLAMNGHRPLWAWIAPHNGAAFYRDASHAGTTSTQYPATANAATGITGGAPDSISVGIALNANGVTYDVLIIVGDTAAGNGGFSPNGEFVPVSPDSPAGGDVSGGLWDATPPDPELSPDEPDAGGGSGPGVDPDLPDGQTGSDFQTGCVAATTFIVNQALTHIGVSKFIGDITTELSPEATVSRLHYIDDVSAVLRDHPWQFATRYARLVLVAGTSTVPVNGDWQYSYRPPADMMFARRIVNPNLVGRAFDPNPPKWRLGSDDTGLLIYSNETPISGQPGNVTPELEYTIRTDCVALQGDAIFRQALTWRHAFSICPALAKDPEKRGTFCWQMYNAIKGTASTVGSNEVQQEKSGEAEWISGRD